MKNVKVSVITPIYNRFNFIKNALKLLKSQTLKEIEFLIVDDGSTDGSYEYLLKSTKTDKRFKILKLNTNTGPSMARNLALDNVNGEYIGFFDIDDVIPSDYFEKLFNFATKNKADIVFATYNNLKHSKTGKISGLSEKIDSLYNGALWDKLFKSDLIKQNNIEFPVGLYCADNVFVFKSFYWANSVFVCNNPIYTYSLSSDSISCDLAKEKKRKSDILKILDTIVNFVKKNSFNKEEIESVYNFLQRTFNVYHTDQKFSKKRDNILLKIQPKWVYSHRTRKIKGKSSMFWLRMGKNLGLISRKSFEEKAAIRPIEKSGLFDAKWYLETYPDVKGVKINPIKHYIKTGWKHGYNPSPDFNNDAYLTMYPDVAAAKICPLIHYIKFGYNEGRLPGLDPRYIQKIKKSLKTGNKLQYILEYPVRVYDEYQNLKNEINELEKNK